MTKFNAPLPQASAPPVGDLSPAPPEAPLAKLRRDAHAEARLRLKYQILQRVLAVIDTLEAAPDDWRSRLQAVNDATRLFVDDADLIEDAEDD